MTSDAKIRGFAVLAVAWSMALSSCSKNPSGDKGYLDIAATPLVETDTPFEEAMLGRVGTPFVGSIRARAGRTAEQLEDLQTPRYALFRPGEAMAHLRGAFLPGDAFEGDAMKGVQIDRSNGILAGVPQKAGRFESRPRCGTGMRGHGR